MSKYFIVFSLLMFVLWLAGFLLYSLNSLIILLSFIPSPLILFLLLTSAFLVRHKKIRTDLLVLVLVCSLLPAYRIAVVENNWQKITNSSREHITLMHWNVAWGKYGLDAISKAIQSKSADIMVISEPPLDKKFNDFVDLFKEKYKYLFRYKLLIAVKGEYLKSKWSFTQPGMMVWMHEIAVKGKKLKLFIVDIRADPLLPRRPIIDHLKSLIEKHKPDIVVGDLNIPRRYIRKLGLPYGYSHAYDLVGRGWSYSWPMPFPMLGLDQIICSSRIRPYLYSLKSYWSSDHRMQEFKFDIK